MKYDSKDVIFKYKNIVSVIDYDQDAGSKEKEENCKLFYYGKAKINFILVCF